MQQHLHNKVLVIGYANYTTGNTSTVHIQHSTHLKPSFAGCVSLQKHSIYWLQLQLGYIIKAHYHSIVAAIIETFELVCQYNTTRARTCVAVCVVLALLTSLPSLCEYSAVTKWHPACPHSKLGPILAK